MITPRVRKLLDDIDTVLAEGSNDSADLAKVLSALRGPDNVDSALKGSTTAFIRRAAFPKTYDAWLDDAFSHQWSFWTNGEHITMAWRVDHFRDHIYQAAQALGLQVVFTREEDE